MPLYHVAKDKLESVSSTSFAEEKMLEREDIQRLLKTDISPLGDNLMVICEEFCNWEDSNRRSWPAALAIPRRTEEPVFRRLHFR